jgi:predicted amidohydrolase YtcJ
LSKTIYTNGVIYTLDENHPIVETVVVEDEKIIDLGSHRDMTLQWGRAHSETIDLNGKMVTPGLIDSHMHLSGVAFNFLDLNLTGVTSKSEMLDRIKARAKLMAQGQWLVGMGWDENLFEDGAIPTIDELDHVAPHCPIYLKRICHHAFLVNTKALEMSGYQPGNSVPMGGTVVLDPNTKLPTGLLLESASGLITNHIPEKTYDDLKAGLKAAMKFAVSQGLTSIHTNDPVYLGGFDQTYKLYDELINQEQNGLRCNLLIDYSFLKRMKETGMVTGFGNEKLQIGAVKLFADGALGRRTALLSEPYHDQPGQYGEAMQTQEELYEMVREVREAGMPVAIHTIGDQALANVLEILDQFPNVSHRDRLVHTSIIRKELLPRLAVPNRIADIQPRFVVSDYPWVIERIGEEREQDLYAWKTLLSSGLLCAGGSDAPVEPVDPLLGIHAAVTRKSPGQTHKGWNEKEKLGMIEAIKLFTIGGVQATSEEKIKGTISKGKLADMTVFSKNLLSMKDPDELLETKIEMTIIDGTIQ